jgi:hypothetical protein
MVDSLLSIALEEGTDKAYRFAVSYDKLFSGLRGEEGVLVEIGVAWLSSIRMWHRYFPRFIIYGVDKRRGVRPWMILRDLVALRSDITKRYSFDGMVRLVYGDQSRKRDLFRVRDRIGGWVDIVVDDGSHVPDDQMLSFWVLYPLVKPGGFYVVEDVPLDSPLRDWLRNYHYRCVNDTVHISSEALVVRKPVVC